MASNTGAPWNLPYPEDTDLVRDGASDIEALAVATAAGLDLAGNEGIGPNVVSTVMTDTFSATVARATLTGDVTGLTATITPSTATSKVLLVIHMNVAGDGETAAGDSGPMITLFRDGSEVTGSVGDADGSRRRVTQVSAYGNNGTSGYAANQFAHVSFAYLDSPMTDLPVTYSIRLSHARTINTAVHVNRTMTNTNADTWARPSSTITAIEVAP